MKTFLLSLPLFISFFSGAYASQSLTLSTFNLNFFGLGAELSGTPQDEYRDNWIKEFISLTPNLSTSDVIVFEEVVDVPRLINLLGAEKYSCLSYSSHDLKHQHVVLCHDKKFQFIPAANDSFIISEVAFSYYRPAVWGILTDQLGNALATIVGVHLKAKPDGETLRLKQAQIISDSLQKLDPSLPKIVLGDFNAYGHDVENIQNIFQASNLQHVDQPLHTYRTGSFLGNFDHFWISSHMKVKEISVAGPCNSGSAVNPRRFEDVAFYNRLVSDHCPVTVALAWE